MPIIDLDKETDVMKKSTYRIVEESMSLEEMRADCDMTPLRNQVVLRRAQLETESESGILLGPVDESGEFVERGIVARVGPDVINVRPGDYVSLRPNHGINEKSLSENDYYFIEEKYVLCIRNMSSRKLVSEHELNLELYKVANGK